MPLSCDCYPGCWAEHSENWSCIQGTPEFISSFYEIARRVLPHGSYVLIEETILRCETLAMLNELIALRSLEKPVIKV